jgi:hypothetical protein
MPSLTFVVHHKQTPKGEQSRPPLPSSSTCSIGSNVNYNANACTNNASDGKACDKSITTCSTEDMSFASVSSASAAVTTASVNSANVSANSNNNMNTSTISTGTTNTNTNTSFTSMNRPIRSLSSPVPLHSQLSLLDMTMDESHDDESSIEPTKTTPRKYSQKNSYLDSSINNTSADSSFNQSYDLGNSMSILSQTEKNLAAISESMTTGSFCGTSNHNKNQDSNHAPCGSGAGNCITSSSSCTSPNNDDKNENNGGNSSTFSDTLVQNRLFDDFNYLLGSHVMPCCQEKMIFANCFNGGSSFTIDDDDHQDHNTNTATSSSSSFSHKKTNNKHNSSSNPSTFINNPPPNKIRNRAGESWRARAYRIRKLREERMIKSGDNFLPNNTTNHIHNTANGTTNGIGTHNPYSFSNRRQLSMERAIGKSHSTDWRSNNSWKVSSPPTYTTDMDTAKSSSFSSCHWNSTLPSSSSRRRRPKHEVNSDPLGCIIGDCIDPIAPLKEDAVELEVVWKQDNADLCYDSDPGETSFRKSLFKNNDEIGTIASKKNSERSSTPSGTMSRSKSLVMSTGEDNNSNINKASNQLRARRRNHYSSFDRKYEEDDHFLGGNDSFDIHVSFDHDVSRSTNTTTERHEEEEEEEDEEVDDEDYDDDEDDEETSLEDECHSFEGSNGANFNAMRNQTFKADLGIAQNVQVSYYILSVFHCLDLGGVEEIHVLLTSCMSSYPYYYYL